MIDLEAYFVFNDFHITVDVTLLKSIEGPNTMSQTETQVTQRSFSKHCRKT